MNPEESKTNEALGRTLKAWKVAEPLPPRFAEGVWQRIARNERRAPDSILITWLERFRRGIIHPALAGSYIALLLFAGSGVGYWRAQVVKERVTEELGARYVHLMDPYQMPRQ